MVVEACRLSSLCVQLPFLWFFSCMPPPLCQHLRIWAGVQIISAFWWIYPSPVPGLTCWRGFSFLSGIIFAEVNHFVAPPQPHPEIWTRLPPCSSPAYGTWQFHWYCLPGTYCCPEWFHWVSLSILNRKFGGLPLPGKQPRSCLIMRWVQQLTGTHQLTSRMGKASFLLIPYPMTIQMHINLPYFPSFWLHLHLLGIPLFFSSPLIPLPICVYRRAFLYNFEWWTDRTSVLAWDLMLVDYRLLQF